MSEYRDTRLDELLDALTDISVRVGVKHGREGTGGDGAANCSACQHSIEARREAVHEYVAGLPSTLSVERMAEALSYGEQPEETRERFRNRARRIIAALSVESPVRSPAWQRECVWEMDDGGIYETGCGNSFFFEAGTATENRARFCQYCGATLIDGTPPDAAVRSPEPQP